MLRLDCLPPETGRLLEAVSGFEEIGSFTLVGGTALTLSWGHRLSADLDFAYPALDLPRPACRAIIERLERAGWRIEDITDDQARIDHENDGFDLADSQQDWLCRHAGTDAAVKLTFFVEFADESQASFRLPPLRHGRVGIMPPEGIFPMKSRLILKRATLRDLFDLWTFLERGRTVDEILFEARRADRYCTYERLRSRLLPVRIPATDPGLEPLTDRAPATFEEVKAALRVHLDEYEATLAARMLMKDEGEESQVP